MLFRSEGVLQSETNDETQDTEGGQERTDVDAQSRQGDEEVDQAEPPSPALKEALIRVSG